MVSLTYLHRGKIDMESKPVSDNRPKPYEVSSLRLDGQNPRLPPEAKDWPQNELLMHMEEYFDLLPIARSMSDNGYFDEEPVIIIPKEDEPEAFTVIEGNRRLAALKFLTDPELRAKSAYKGEYDKLAADAKENLLRIPAVRYENRSETVAMLGFRHIAGIWKWPSLSKARFVHRFAQANRDLTLSEIARTLGYMHTGTIRRNYAAYSIYLQAKGVGIDTSKLEKDFSVFYTALGRVAFQNFIGVRISGSTIEELQEPVPEEHHDELREIITWIHGTEEQEPVVPESRDLKFLAAVLQAPEALDYLRSGGRLRDAYSLTVGEERSVIDSINKASFYIEESLRFVHRHKTSASVHEAFSRCALSLREALRYFPDVLKELAS